MSCQLFITPGVNSGTVIVLQSVLSTSSKVRALLLIRRMWKQRKVSVSDVFYFKKKNNVTLMKKCLY